MSQISTRASQLPQSMTETARRLEQNPSVENHRSLAVQAKEHLAKRNVDSFISDTEHGHFVVIKDEPINSELPQDKLTGLAQNLRKQGVALNLFTSYYLSGMAGFMSMNLEPLNDLMSLGLSWKDLDAKDEFSSELDHELRHVEQHQARLKAREQGGENPFPDIRVKFLDESQALSPWVVQKYNGRYGHTIDEHDAYLHQSRVELERAAEDSGNTEEVQKHAKKALDLSVRSALFALTDAQALTLKSPEATWDKPKWEDLHGDISIKDNGVQLWVDSRDIDSDELAQGLGREVEKLRQGERKAQANALEAFGLLEEGPLKEAWRGELAGLGWAPEE